MPTVQNFFRLLFLSVISCVQLMWPRAGEKLLEKTQKLMQNGGISNLSAKLT